MRAHNRRYFLKVVPTKYTAYRKSELKTNQYSVTENEKSFENSAGLPGVFFSYDRPHPTTKTLHGGAPVEAGEKWVATKWLREGEFK